MISLKDFKEFEIEKLNVKGGECDPRETGGGFDLVYIDEVIVDGVKMHINTYRAWDSDWNDGTLTYFNQRYESGNLY